MEVLALFASVYIIIQGPSIYRVSKNDSLVFFEIPNENIDKLALASKYYDNSCHLCRTSVGGNGDCAHYTSDALRRAGFNVTSKNIVIKERCNWKESGGNPIRAHELGKLMR